VVATKVRARKSTAIGEWTQALLACGIQMKRTADSGAAAHHEPKGDVVERARERERALSQSRSRGWISHQRA